VGENYFDIGRHVWYFFMGGGRMKRFLIIDVSMYVKVKVHCREHLKSQVVVYTVHLYKFLYLKLVPAIHSIQ
jgi:hypothetical protein